ncbi:GNAT family N-acetyltransferase [Cellulomonas fimi]|uniref:N-acetyltransferase n=1 Tax=Cellulomonas fimi TaxID=1708 RepID=A0A7Y0LZL8_CELFI|nr:GNAT family N-acetyltransferase [Cellulomonas fimi]NMR21113.1 N-acetyltransferase [Cellulomonas fimi]
MDNLTVTDNAPAHRFEARADDGTVLGFVAYDIEAAARLQGEADAVVVTHTQVDPQYEGQGVGATLARGALDLIRESGRGVVPLCPFVSAYIRRHPEYQGMVQLEQDTGQGG